MATAKVVRWISVFKESKEFFILPVLLNSSQRFILGLLMNLAFKDRAESWFIRSKKLSEVIEVEEVIEEQVIEGDKEILVFEKVICSGLLARDAISESYLDVLAILEKLVIDPDSEFFIEDILWNENPLSYHRFGMVCRTPREGTMIVGLLTEVLLGKIPNIPLNPAVLIFEITEEEKSEESPSSFFFSKGQKEKILVLGIFTDGTITPKRVINEVFRALKSALEPLFAQDFQFQKKKVFEKNFWDWDWDYESKKFQFQKIKVFEKVFWDFEDEIETPSILSLLNFVELVKQELSKLPAHYYMIQNHNSFRMQIRMQKLQKVALAKVSKLRTLLSENQEIFSEVPVNWIDFFENEIVKLNSNKVQILTVQSFYKILKTLNLVFLIAFLIVEFEKVEFEKTEFNINKKEIKINGIRKRNGKKDF